MIRYQGVHALLNDLLGVVAHEGGFLYIEVAQHLVRGTSFNYADDSTVKFCKK